MKKSYLGGGLLLLACTVLLNHSERLADAAYVALLPVAIVAVCLIYAPERVSLDFRHMQKPVLISSILLSVLFLLMSSLLAMILYGVLSRNAIVYDHGAAMGTVLWMVNCVTLLFGSLFCSCVLLCNVFQRLLRVPAGNCEQAVSRGFFAKCFLPIVILSLFGLMCAYPKYDTSDVNLMLDFSTIPYWSEWHTMGYLFFVRIFYLLSGSVFLPVVCANILWLLTNHYALRVLSRTQHAKKACVAYTVLSLMSYLPYLYSGILLKDGLMATCMLGFCISIAEVLYQKELTGKTVVFLVLYGTGASLFRHACIYIVAISLIVLILCGTKNVAKRMRRWMTLGLALICCVYFLLINVLSYRVLHAERNPAYIAYTVPLGMVAAVAAKDVPIDAEDLAVMEKIMPREKWAACYEDPFFLDPVARDWGTVGHDVYKVDQPGMHAAIIKLNAKFLMQYPVVYLRAYLKITSILWEWGRPMEGYEWPPHSLAYRTTPVTQTFGFSRIMTNLADITYDNVIYRSLVWRGGFALFVLLFVAVLALLKRQAKLLIAMLPIGMFEIMMFLAIPAQDPRFLLSQLVCAVFLVVFCSVLPNNRKDARPPLSTMNETRVTQ